MRDVLLIWLQWLRVAALALLGVVTGSCWVVGGFMLFWTDEGVLVDVVLLLCAGLFLGFVSMWSLAGALLGIFLTSNESINVHPSAYAELLLIGAAGVGLSRWRRRSRLRTEALG